jgi:hypothetical protein
MSLPRTLALLCLLGSIAACADARPSSSAPHLRSAPPTPAASARAPQTTLGSGLIPKPDLLRFRRGLIDNTGWHGIRDARVYPDGRLAVMTYDGGCPSQPVLLSVEDASHIDLTYGSVPGAGPACLALLAPYTAVLKLPRTVNLDRPLAVSVHFPSSDSYTLTARTA